jgi:hypothetical protein
VSATTGSVDAVHDRRPRLRALRAPAIAGACLACVGGYVALADPGDGGGVPCPFRVVTGWWCPGCGLTRATHQVLRGDLVQALRFNVFVLVVLLGIAAAWISWVRSAATGVPVRPIRPSLVGAATAVALAFAVVRNLPGIDGLRG